jgi:hypothetical protein
MVCCPHQTNDGSIAFIPVNGAAWQSKKKTRSIRVFLVNVIFFVGDRLTHRVIANHLFRFVALDQPMGQQEADDQ